MALIFCYLQVQLLVWNSMSHSLQVVEWTSKEIPKSTSIYVWLNLTCHWSSHSSLIPRPCLSFSMLPARIEKIGEPGNWVNLIPRLLKIALYPGFFYISCSRCSREMLKECRKAWVGELFSKHLRIAYWNPGSPFTVNLEISSGENI